MIRIEADFKSIDEFLAFARKLAEPTEKENGETQEDQSLAQATMEWTSTPTTPTGLAPTQPVFQMAATPMTLGQTGPAPFSAPPTAPTSVPSYTPDDLARAAMTLMDSGRQRELIGLLQTFGVSSLPELRPEQYGGFATALRGLGAQI